MNELATIANRLKFLKLNGMAEAVSDLMRLSLQMRPSLEMALSKMVEAETRHRDDSRTARLLKASKLRYRVLIEDISCSTARNLTHEQLTSIADCGFVRRGENLLITGLTGCGKSYLACALGHQACTLGIKTLYLNMNRFVDVLKQSRLDGTFSQMLSRLDKNDLIMLDDFGLQKMDGDTRIALLTLLEERYEKRSLIIISQLPLDKWYDYIAEATLADAIMDRLVNSSHHVSLEGPSLRKKKIR
jgi:DNA replication protein DnaC